MEQVKGESPGFQQRFVLSQFPLLTNPPGCSGTFFSFAEDTQLPAEQRSFAEGCGELGLALELRSKAQPTPSQPAPKEVPAHPLPPTLLSWAAPSHSASTPAASLCARSMLSFHWTELALDSSHFEFPMNLQFCTGASRH